MFLMTAKQPHQEAVNYDKLRGVYQNGTFSQESIRIIRHKKQRLFADKIDSCAEAACCLTDLYAVSSATPSEHRVCVYLFHGMNHLFRGGDSADKRKLVATALLRLVTHRP